MYFNETANALCFRHILDAQLAEQERSGLYDQESADDAQRQNECVDAGMGSGVLVTSEVKSLPAAHTVKLSNK